MDVPGHTLTQSPLPYAVWLLSGDTGNVRNEISDDLLQIENIY